MLAKLWSKWTNRGKQTSHKPASARRLLPCLEVLEDRCTPTVAIAQFPVLTASSSPFGITTGADGNIWFTENQANAIGTINPTTHAVTEFALPTASSGPLDITAGPDGNIWFTENQTNEIGMINTTTHAITQFAIPTASSGPVGITAGPDGNLWFTEFGANQIGEINPTTHAVTEFAIPTASSGPLGIAAGPDGNIWFTEANGSKIGTINPTLHTITEYALPSGSSQPIEITVGPNGNMWFVENGSNQIGEINTSTDAFTNFSIPTASSGAYGITAGSDDNIWFTEGNANQIGEIDLATGTVTETALPSGGATPTNIIAGPGGTLWFTQSSGNQIGEVVAAPTVTTVPASQTVVAGQTATFTTAAVGFPTPTVTWEVSTNNGATFTALTDSGVYSGVTTDTLTITDATTAMTGYEYEAVFTNGISPTATTTAASLTVKSALSITPEPPQGVAGTNYNQTLSVLGSTTPFNVFAVNNFNPGTTGLTAGDITASPGNGTITISGTPTAAGTATFTVTVANTGGNTLTQNMTITIRPPLSIATGSLPTATAGIDYVQTISVVGGALPYTAFTVTNFSAGSTGLSASNITALAANGAFNINAVPTAAGSASFTVNVTDSAGDTVTQNYTINVDPALVITPSLPAGTAGTTYNQTLSVTGGGVPYTSLTVSNFDGGTTGLALSNVQINNTAATVTIDGTPTGAGTITFTATVIDSIGAVVTEPYIVTINPPLSITPALPDGTAGTNYLQTLTVAGGTQPYQTFTVTGFNGGTTGLTAAALATNAATGTIIVNGLPTAAGTVAFTVNVTDANGSQLTQNYNLTINAAPTIGDLSVTQWTKGQAGFTGTMAISDGTSPFTIASSTGLPTGLTAALNGNTIDFTGTPTAVGTYAGSVTLSDAAGASVTKAFSITINPALATGNLTTTQWTTGVSGFTSTMAVGGGTGALTLAGTSGLPTGVTAVLDNGTISFTGTPTAVGTFAGSVTLSDSIGATVTKTFNITINAPPSFGDLTTAQWTQGKSGFPGVIPLAGGTGQLTIVSTSGLPTGLTAVVSGNAIHFTGTPSSAQTFAVGQITVRDAVGASVTDAFGITINPPPVITTTSLPTTRMGALYSLPVQTTGGTGPLTFAITDGSLPPGMKLSSTGEITGVSRGLGSFTVTITATDAAGATVSKQYTLSISLK